MIHVVHVLQNRAAAWLLLLLFTGAAACDRNLYLGRDTLDHTTTADLGEQLAPMLDAGTAPVATSAAPQLRDQTSTTDPMQQADAPSTTAQPPPATTAPSLATPLLCEAGHADCDGGVADGCETDLMHDRGHCGSCGSACQTEDCSCESGKLTLSCPKGKADCDGDVSNGCEADLNTSLDHCGACKRVCHHNGHDATAAKCVAGRCEVTCEPRFSQEADCDGNPDNGCEAYLMFDRQNCGACGNVCFTNCEGGFCML